MLYNNNSNKLYALYIHNEKGNIQIKSEKYIQYNKNKTKINNSTE